MNYDELRSIVLKDPEVKKIKPEDHELMTALRYIEAKKEKDSEYVPVLIRREGTLEVVMRPTEEYSKELEKEAKKSKITTLDTENYLFVDARLSDFELLNDEREKAYLKASRFVDLFKDGQKTKGLYLHGSFGTGKTYLLSAIVNELADEKDVYFIYFPDLVRSMKSSIGTNDLEDKVKSLKNCDLLIFDDIGSENMSAWFRDEILAPVLQFRLASSLPTLFSSNFSPAMLVKFFAHGNNAEVDEQKAARIVYRIREMTEEVTLMERYLKD